MGGGSGQRVAKGRGPSHGCTTGSPARVSPTRCEPPGPVTRVRCRGHRLTRQQDEWTSGEHRRRSIRPARRWPRRRRAVTRWPKAGRARSPPTQDRGRQEAPSPGLGCGRAGRRVCWVGSTCRGGRAHARAAASPRHSLGWDPAGRRRRADMSSGGGRGAESAAVERRPRGAYLLLGWDGAGRRIWVGAMIRRTAPRARLSGDSRSTPHTSLPNSIAAASRGCILHHTHTHMYACVRAYSLCALHATCCNHIYIYMCIQMCVYACVQMHTYCGGVYARKRSPEHREKLGH